MYLKVRVIPLSKRERIRQIRKDSYSVFVKEPQIRNQANRKMLEMLGKHLDVPKEKLKIVSGHRYPRKMVQIKK